MCFSVECTITVANSNAAAGVTFSAGKSPTITCDTGYALSHTNPVSCDCNGALTIAAPTCIKGEF